MKEEKFETKTIETNRLLSRKYFCDKCKTEIQRSGYSKNNYFIRLAEGDNYPEGGYVEIEEAYFCTLCSDEIKNLLIENGVTFESREEEY